MLVPSLVYETFGLIALEAFAQRTPVIVRDLGAPPEVVADSGGGFTYRTQDELVEAMERLRTIPPLRAELGSRGYEAWRRLWSEDAHLEGVLRGDRRGPEPHDDDGGRPHVPRGRGRGRLRSASSRSAFARSSTACWSVGADGTDDLASWQHASVTGRVPARAVAITFDDGCASVARTAAPLLAERGLTATVFCVAGHLGGRNDWPTQHDRMPSLALAGADELVELHRAGVEIGAHGVAHAPLDARR